MPLGASPRLKKSLFGFLGVSLCVSVIEGGGGSVMVQNPDRKGMVRLTDQIARGSIIEAVDAMDLDRVGVFFYYYYLFWVHMGRVVEPNLGNADWPMPMDHKIRFYLMSEISIAASLFCF